jgi:hypothetical protein
MQSTWRAQRAVSRRARRSARWLLEIPGEGNDRCRRQACDIAPADLQAFLRSVRRASAHRHLVQPRRESVDQRYRQGERDHQPAPCDRDRIGKPGAGPFSVSPASPMRWAGARSADSPRCSRRIWASATPSATGRSVSGNRRPICPEPRSEGRRHVSMRWRRAGSRRCGSWRPTPPSRCPMRDWRGSRSPTARSSWSRTDRCDRHRHSTPR